MGEWRARGQRVRQEPDHMGPAGCGEDLVFPLRALENQWRVVGGGKMRLNFCLGKTFSSSYSKCGPEIINHRLSDPIPALLNRSLYLNTIPHVVRVQLEMKPGLAALRGRHCRGARGCVGEQEGGNCRVWVEMPVTVGEMGKIRCKLHLGYKISWACVGLCESKGESRSKMILRIHC